MVVLLAVMTPSLHITHALPMNFTEDDGDFTYCAKSTNQSVKDQLPSEAYEMLKHVLGGLNLFCSDSAYNLVSVHEYHQPLQDMVFLDMSCKWCNH